MATVGYFDEKHLFVSNGVECKGVYSTEYTAWTNSTGWIGGDGNYQSRAELLEAFGNPTWFPFPTEVGEYKLIDTDDGEFWINVVSVHSSGGEYRSVMYWKSYNKNNGTWYPSTGEYTDEYFYIGYGENNGIYLALIRSEDDSDHVVFPCYPVQQASTLKWYLSITTWGSYGANDFRSIYNSLFYSCTYAPEGGEEEVQFYNFSKKINSTKQPSGGTAISGTFRTPFNVLNPVLQIESESDAFPYNYMSWYDDSCEITRYYWIQNKVWYPTGIIEISLEEDTLATYKSGIRNMDAFVVRSANNFNPLISDSYYATEEGVDVTYTDSISPLSSTNGFYVVAIACQDYRLGWIDYYFAKKGGVMYFICNTDDLKELINWLNFTGSTGEWADYDPFSRIVSVKYVPVAVTWVDVEEDELLPQYTGYTWLFHHTYVDEDGVTQTAYYNWILHKTISLNGATSKTLIYTMFWQNHPQYSANKKYLNYPPFTDVELKVGPFGQVRLPLNKIPQDDTDLAINVELTIDLISGLSRLNVYSNVSDNETFIYYTEDYSCVVDIPITYERYNKYSDIMQRDFSHDVGIAESVTQMLSGAAQAGVGGYAGSGGAIAQGINMIASGAVGLDKVNKKYAIDSYNMSIPNFASKVSNGNWIKMDEDWYLIQRSILISGDSPDIVGRPKNAQASLGDCSGYTLCNAASFEDENATIVEITMVNEFLNNGFYLE